ncbi:hypothetical protein A6V39_05190 [Candidatus Mycoplasma haematobovis]|uniref:Uncharacterized protein n=1 Tax=Candidatus Mycoplasma haematobovis TaxID=432608 RepID=A0A1A9QBJ5_9MOLU|nr:hypothetical protein [Candidatus Mycoplasma haematobovis]OAL09823.1 hypothetical protein A6V39_05190 [Candidatus Mycoplasma haematobovis]
MSKLLPTIAVGVGGTAVIGGVGGYLLSTQNTKTIKETFNEAIINFETEDKLVKEKLKKLKDATDLSEKSIFKVAQVAEKKTTDSGLAEFKKACTKIYDSNFTKKDSETFNNFKDYCARTIKDKVTTEKWASTDANWENRLTKLKNNNPRPLSETLTKLPKKSNVDKEALQRWCTNAESLVFEGESNLDFKDAQAYCGKAD